MEGFDSNSPIAGFSFHHKSNGWCSLKIVAGQDHTSKKLFHSSFLLVLACDGGDQSTKPRHGKLVVQGFSLERTTKVDWKSENDGWNCSVIGQRRYSGAHCGIMGFAAE